MIQKDLFFKWLSVLTFTCGIISFIFWFQSNGPFWWLFTSICLMILPVVVSVWWVKFVKTVQPIDQPFLDIEQGYI